MAKTALKKTEATTEEKQPGQHNHRCPDCGVWYYHIDGECPNRGLAWETCFECSQKVEIAPLFEEAVAKVDPGTSFEEYNLTIVSEGGIHINTDEPSEGKSIEFTDEGKFIFEPTAPCSVEPSTEELDPIVEKLEKQLTENGNLLMQELAKHFEPKSGAPGGFGD